MAKSTKEIESAVLPTTWDDVEEKAGGGDFQLLRAGTYEFYLSDFEKREAEESGNSYLHLTIIHEKDEDDVEEGEQRRFYVFPNLHFTPKTLGMTKHALKVMGGDLSLLKGVPVEAGEVPDEVLDILDGIKDDQETFQCRVRIRKGKSKDGSPFQQNEVVRWVGADD